MEIVGEKINTSRTSVGQAVRERDAGFIEALAREQAQAGAAYLDVNSGLALYPEQEGEDLAWLVSVVQGATDLPACVDSTRGEALEAALRVHRGPAMINSVNGDPETMAAVFPLAKQYGCKVVATTTSRAERVPAGSRERLRVAEAIAREATRAGIPLEDLYFDPLVLSLATGEKNALTFLETVRVLKKGLPGAKTIAGLSNVSFGLPQRRLLNRGFLVLALGCGMDAAILDPTDRELVALARATETLLGGDPFCARYLKAFREGRLGP
jgi:5-methyltetrahydrofolate--homocysteine methyltransferase